MTPTNTRVFLVYVQVKNPLPMAGISHDGTEVALKQAFEEKYAPDNPNTYYERIVVEPVDFPR